MARCFGCRVVYPILLFTLAATISAMAQENPGAAVYAKRCAVCHDKTAVRMPSRSVLQQRSATFILKTLNAGVMKAEAASLSDAERAQVAGWLGRKTALGLDKTALANPCHATSSSAAASGAPSWTSWGGGLENQRFQPAATAGLAAAQAVNLKVKWAFGMPDVTSLRSQPVVFAGNLLFGGGTVLYSLDAASGCTHWATELPSAIRSGIVMGSPAEKPLAFFGDSAANVYAVDAVTGAPVWQVQMDPHPVAMVTGTPVYHEGRLYVPVSSFEELAAVKPGYVCCTFRGSMVALDAATGKILWQTYTIDSPATQEHVNKLGTSTKGPSGAAIWARRPSIQRPTFSTRSPETTTQTPPPTPAMRYLPWIWQPGRWSGGASSTPATPTTFRATAPTPKTALTPRAPIMISALPPPFIRGRAASAPSSSPRSRAQCTPSIPTMEANSSGSRRSAAEARWAASSGDRPPTASASTLPFPMSLF